MSTRIPWIFLAFWMIGCSAEINAQTSSIDHPLQIRDLGDDWIEVEGESQVVNITPEEARRRALKDARERAILFAVGIDVQAYTALLQEENEAGVHSAFYALSEQASAGRIVDERPPVWASYEIPGRPVSITVYRARVQVKVAREEGESDPGFWVEVSLNKSRFHEGEEMRLAVTASRPCYVTVLNLTAADTVVMLLPHEYRQDRQVTPGDTLWIPDADEEAMGIHYRVLLPAEREQVTEMIKVVATRSPYAFAEGLPRVSFYNQVPTRQAAWVELMRWLVQIPRDQRTEAQAAYQVVKRKE